VDSVDNREVVHRRTCEERWPVLAEHPEALDWLRMQSDLGMSPRTIDAYGRAVADYLTVCRREGIEPLTANRSAVASYVRELLERPNPRGGNVVTIGSGVGLANATLQQRLVAVRLFYDHLVEEGRRDTNPVGRGRYTPGKAFGRKAQRGLLPRFSRLPWIPTDDQWQEILTVAKDEPIRNRVMFALAYDAGLRREELCLVRTDDIDPGHRTVRVRAETTKTRVGRAVPYSVTTGVLLQAYLEHRRAISRTRGQLFVSESRRNFAQPITLWTWSKVVRSIALRAGIPDFSTHALRHLCLTHLARSGRDLHTIARFAGHRNPATTLQYIHLSGRELALALRRGMEQVHGWRVETLAALAPDRQGSEV